MFVPFIGLAVLLWPGPRATPAPTLLAARSEHIASVRIGAGTVSAPDTLSSGWTRVRMSADGPNHAPALFRLPAGVTRANLAAFLADLDTAAATPEGALSLGGRIAADSGEIIVDLAPGRYVVTCLTKDDGGHRHGIAGESRLLVVTRARAPTSPRPRASVSMRMTVFAYVGPDRWPAGSYLVRVENVGRQDHQFRISRLPQGVTPAAVVRSADPRQLLTPVNGIGRMGPGVAYLPVRLAPGSYMLFCLVHDPATGQTHNKLGMYRLIEVR